VQEQVNDKAVAISVKTTKLTGRILARAMRDFLKKLREPCFKHGKQSVRSLAKQGASLTNIEITGENIGSFGKCARKYNIDFALKKDASEGPPRWLVFFKARDADALTAAFREYGKAQLGHREHKPSLLARLEKEKEIAALAALPVKNKDRGERQLR
jgi:hypothetical protein